MHDFIIHVLL